MRALFVGGEELKEYLDSLPVTKILHMKWRCKTVKVRAGAYDVYRIHNQTDKEEHIGFVFAKGGRWMWKSSPTKYGKENSMSDCIAKMNDWKEEL